MIQTAPRTEPVDPILDAEDARRMLGGIGRTTLWALEKNKLVTPHIKFTLGGRKKGWLLSELQAINTARARGVDENALRQLVIELEAKRHKNATA